LMVQIPFFYLCRLKQAEVFAVLKVVRSMD